MGSSIPEEDPQDGGTGAQNPTQAASEDIPPTTETPNSENGGMVKPLTPPPGDGDVGNDAHTNEGKTKPDSAQEEAKPTGEAGEKKEDEEERPFCPVNGQRHSHLVRFRVRRCKLCKSSLKPAVIAPPDAPGTTYDSTSYFSTSAPASSSSEDEKPRPKEEEKKKADMPPKEVQHVVEYRDTQNKVIARPMNWEGNFHLPAAREVMDERARCIFRVWTVLKTSVPPLWARDRHDSDYRIHSRNIHAQILKNPNIAVSLHRKRISLLSRPLIGVLRELIPYYPSVNLEGEIVHLSEPLAFIAHHYERLDDYVGQHGTPPTTQVADGSTSQQSVVQGEPEATGANHLGKLLDYFRETALDDVLNERKRHMEGKCTFRMLWLLFQPDTTVYTELRGRFYAFVISSVTTDPAVTSNVSGHRLASYQVRIWNLQYNGRRVGRRTATVVFPSFEGERKIVSLPLIPCEFIDREDGGETKRKLEDEGRKWYSLLRGAQMYYSGPMLNARRRQLQGRVYVDSTSFLNGDFSGPWDSTEMDDQGGAPDWISDSDGYSSSSVSSDSSGPRRRRGRTRAKCHCEECKGQQAHPPRGYPWMAYSNLDPNVQRDLTLFDSNEGPNHRYLICDKLLYGLDLRSRSWVRLHAAYCMPLKPNLRAIDSLVMPPERKNMIMALIQKFTKPETGRAHQAWAADFIESKGEGQIFLLHGSPGVGKTYTAEYTGRPLLSLTCGDIGTDEVEVEKRLSKWFKLAETWGAVMLIDEADVYLERRQVTDLKRNSLVSVFLRCIEYYRGVLFLTTNRVGHFDDAFVSRIHVVIRYNKLSASDRRTIWQQFFDKLDDDRQDFTTTRRAKDYVLEDGEISRMEWNGREIRNAFQTAVALAEFRAKQHPDESKRDHPTLDTRDFEQVCAMMQQFKSYLIDVHGADEEGRAFSSKAY